VELDLKLEELEALLQQFEQDEVPPEVFAPVPSHDAIVLHLAQHNSHKICRREVFCPDERCK
jgi:16S rRNA A1518/A1519 N6-dimethyltransferase RsmA/KsgA/DIM1 with predicted DNA glycosylase/AP lyase activity